MCSWCYAFQPELEGFLEKHPSAEVDWIMGGLAPDNNDPMDESLKQRISSYWYQIEKKTQVSFNHDFWELNTPFRSTYPACRAVISAEMLKAKSAHNMVKAIQSAYYQEAKNPSLKETLIACVRSINLDENQFFKVFESEEIEQQFQQHLSTTRQLQVRGFPALYYIKERNQVYSLTQGYSQTASLEQEFNKIQGK